MTIEEQTILIKTGLDYMAGWCLEDADKYKEYTDEDLLNALTIFMDVFWNKTYEYQKQLLNQEQMEVLAIELGKNMRQTIQLAIGLDTKELVEKIYDTRKSS